MGEARRGGEEALRAAVLGVREEPEFGRNVVRPVKTVLCSGVSEENARRGALETPGAQFYVKLKKRKRDGELGAMELNYRSVSHGYGAVSKQEIPDKILKEGMWEDAR